MDLPSLFMPTGFEKLVEHGFGSERVIKREPVDDLRSAIQEHRRLVVLGEPGSGKTTTLWRLVFDLATAAKNDPDAPLPLLVPLGGYTGSESPLDFAADFFGDLSSWLADYLAQGRVVLLLDALNEMPQRGYRERVGRIQSLLGRDETLSVVVTCRALDYVEELALEKLAIKPLDVIRQRDYLRRYLGEVDGDRLFRQLGGDERRLRYSGSVPPMLELGANPYMLVMLAQVYAAEGILPQNRGKLFAAFSETLLAREAVRRQDAGDGWPSAASVRSGLATLAFAMQEAGERGTAVDRAWVVTQLRDCGCPAEKLLYTAASATLLALNADSVRFVHQLIQAMGEKMIRLANIVYCVAGRSTAISTTCVVPIDTATIESVSTTMIMDFG